MDSTLLFTVTDPRTFPDPALAGGEAKALYRMAQDSLAAETGMETDRLDRDLRDALATMLSGNGALLAAMLAGAPSVAVARHLWRALDGAWRSAATTNDGVGITLFALPLVIVTGLEGGSGEGALAGVLESADSVAAILRDHHALGGNVTFAIADALVAVDAIDVARLPELLAWQRMGQSPVATTGPKTRLRERVLAPAPIALAAGRESVNLRFLVGSALALAGVDLLADTSVGKWGMPLTQVLGRQLGGGVVPVLALPRAPQRFLPAVQQGRLAQREVSAQLFVSNAARKLRAAVGEPSAVISAHRAPGVPGGGELRLSLSSPFEPRDAEGFRCPLYPIDRVGDVASMLVDLLRDCRVTDIRVLSPVFPDRDTVTGLPLLFKPDTIPAEALAPLH